MNRIVSVLGAAVLALFVSSSAFAQGGLINGNVLDQGQAVLPGVTVTVTNEATGISRETVTGGEGQFVLPAIPPGVYTARAELAGFQTQTLTGQVLGVGQELTLRFNLPVAGVAETVSVTAETPLVEVTASRIGSNISEREIDTLPAQGRHHFSLMQTLPGLVPDLGAGDFEGGNFNTNGRTEASNLWMIDGAVNQDTDGGSTGPQQRITLDAMAEFQVLTHQYTAEYGGSSGVIVNAVTKSGTNAFNGRGFYYFEDARLRAIDPFAEAEGQEKPESGSDVFGGNIGGPILRNKAFFFFNFERNLIENAVVHTMPASAAPIATSYSDATRIRVTNMFSRVDYNIGDAGQHRLGLKFGTEMQPVVGEDYDCCVTLEHRIIELKPFNRSIIGDWTAVLGSRATNELRIYHNGELRTSANLAYMGIDESAWRTPGWLEGAEFVGLNGRDQFDIGSANLYEDFSTGLAPEHGGADAFNKAIHDSLTLVAGAHTFKTGFTYNSLEVNPQYIGSGDNGAFSFLHNTPFDPANPSSYPSQFAVLLGETEVRSPDTWVNAYGQDQWRVSQDVTLNLGVRYDWQDMTDVKNAFAPRLGFAWTPTESSRTVIRGGFGKFYEYHVIAVANNLNTRGVLSNTFEFQTDEDESPLDGEIPTSHVCLQPVRDSLGIGQISPACRAFLVGLRGSLQPGAGGDFVNTEPTVDGDRKMGYLWSYSLGFKHQLTDALAFGADYVGNRGRDNTRLIDISQGPLAANGRVIRLTPDEFDPSGTIIPAVARSASFGRVLQYQTRDEFNSDFQSIEMSLEKRLSNRWTSRMAYTLAYANDVPARVSDDLNPRQDYGRSNSDNRHAFSASFNVNPFGGLNVGAIYRTYSGYPINETIGRDVNGDRDNLDRPVRGVDDAGMAIVSDVDSNGRAIRNGIDGEAIANLLDLQLQYVVDMPAGQSVGLFWELYNALNVINYGNPTGNRNSSRFLVPDTAQSMRSMQLGIRYTF